MRKAHVPWTGLLGHFDHRPGFLPYVDSYSVYLSCERGEEDEGGEGSSIAAVATRTIYFLTHDS